MLALIQPDLVSPSYQRPPATPSSGSHDMDELGQVHPVWSGAICKFTLPDSQSPSFHLTSPRPWCKAICIAIPSIAAAQHHSASSSLPACSFFPTFGLLPQHQHQHAIHREPFVDLTVLVPASSFQRPASAVRDRPHTRHLTTLPRAFLSLPSLISSQHSVLLHLEHLADWLDNDVFSPRTAINF